MRPTERPSNNKLKLTSFASLDGLSLQLNLVLSGRGAWRLGEER